MVPASPSHDPDAAWVAVLSTDAAFRKAFRELLDEPDTPASLALAIDCPFTAVSEIELQELRRAEPEVLVVDLEGDPRGGLDFIRNASETGTARAIVAAGRDLSQDLLLQALEAGVTEVLPKPLDPEGTRDTLERVLRRAGTAETGAADARLGRVIALVGAKGGVGTTAIATNLAVAIRRETEGRVLLLDLDVEQGETALLLGLDPQLSLLDLLRNYQPEVSGLLASCIDHEDASGVDLLAAPLQPTPVKAEDLELLSGSRMSEVLAFLREHYDHIVIDRPRSFHPAFSRILEEADERYLITTPDLQALRNIGRSMPHLRRASEVEGEAPMRLVVNRHPVRPAISLQEVEEVVGMKVYHALGADFFPLNESIHERTPAVLRDDSQFAKDVRALATKVIGKAEAERPRRGFLGGIIGAVRSR